MRQGIEVTMHPPAHEGHNVRAMKNVHYVLQIICLHVSNIKCKPRDKHIYLQLHYHNLNDMSLQTW